MQIRREISRQVTMNPTTFARYYPASICLNNPKDIAGYTSNNYEHLKFKELTAKELKDRDPKEKILPRTSDKGETRYYRLRKPAELKEAENQLIESVELRKKNIFYRPLIAISKAKYLLMGNAVTVNDSDLPMGSEVNKLKNPIRLIFRGLIWAAFIIPIALAHIPKKIGDRCSNETIRKINYINPVINIAISPASFCIKIASLAILAVTNFFTQPLRYYGGYLASTPGRALNIVKKGLTDLWGFLKSLAELPAKAKKFFASFNAKPSAPKPVPKPEPASAKPITQPKKPSQDWSFIFSSLKVFTLFITGKRIPQYIKDKQVAEKRLAARRQQVKQLLASFKKPTPEVLKHYPRTLRIKMALGNLIGVQVKVPATIHHQATKAARYSTVRIDTKLGIRPRAATVQPARKQPPSIFSGKAKSFAARPVTRLQAKACSVREADDKESEGDGKNAKRNMRH